MYHSVVVVVVSGIHPTVAQIPQVILEGENITTTGHAPDTGPSPSNGQNKNSQKTVNFQTT